MRLAINWAINWALIALGEEWKSGQDGYLFHRVEKNRKNPQETALSSKGNNKISGKIKKNIYSLRY